MPISRDRQKYLLKLQAILHLVNVNTIERVSRKRGKRVYSVFFLVPKRNGDMRATLDLKWLNLFLVRKKFKVETWKFIMTMLEQDSYMGSIDLSKAYLHIPI